MKSFTALLALSFALAASAAPAAFSKQNGEDAIGLNDKFKGLTVDSPCTDGENVCIDNKFSQCANGKFTEPVSCGEGLICAALPLVNSPGTSVTCTTQSDLDARIAAATGAPAGNDGQNGNNGNNESNNNSTNNNNGGESNNKNNGTANADQGNKNGQNGENNGNKSNNGEGQDNGNGQDEGDNNGQDNGQNDGQDNGDNNGQDNGGNNGQNDGANNGQDNGNNNGGDDGKNNNGGNNGNNGGNDNGDLQTSLCLDPSLVQTGFEKDGQETPAAGQVASATSSNNYINFCATVPNLPLTNGQQVKGGSCNAAPMGIIAAADKIPSAKFQFPKNFDTVKANQNFTVKLAIAQLTTGNFVNAAANYFSAPQTVDDNGFIKGHSHIVIEKINSFTDTQPLNPAKFTFFKGLNDKAEGGVLSAVVPGGLAEGTYRISSINTAANHQPVLVAVAQHGACDDQAFFEVTNSGKPNN